MIKHIVGFVIFSFIIGTSALIAAIFSPAERIVKKVRISRSYDHYSSRKHCKKRKKKKRKRHRVYSGQENRGSLVQAVFDTGKKTLRIERDSGVYDTEKGKLRALHFYFVEESGAKHVLSRPIPISSGVRMSTGWYESLADLVPHGNLYVMETHGDYSEKWNNAPVFDMNKAVPVLIKTSHLPY